MRKVLLIEDNLQEQDQITKSLRSDYVVVSVATLQDAKREIESRPYDLILLDLSLPDDDGMRLFPILESQEQLKKVPVIVITRRYQVEDKIQAFGFGAHDYLVKPVDGRELQARLKALFKRIETKNLDEIVVVGDLKFSLTNQKVCVVLNGEEKPLDLTTLEFKLLLFFVKRESTLLSRDKIIREVWKDHSNITHRAVDTHISHLRKKIKLSQWQIEAVYGEGYRFAKSQRTPQAV